MRIKEARMARGLSQKDFAAMVNIAPNTLSQYETEKREPDLKTLVRISRSLGVSVDYLLGREESSDTKKTSTLESEDERKKADELESRFIHAVQRLPLTQKVALLELVEAAGRTSV